MEGRGEARSSIFALNRRWRRAAHACDLPPPPPRPPSTATPGVRSRPECVRAAGSGRPRDRGKDGRRAQCQALHSLGFATTSLSAPSPPPLSTATPAPSPRISHLLHSLCAHGDGAGARRDDLCGREGEERKGVSKGEGNASLPHQLASADGSASTTYRAGRRLDGSRHDGAERGERGRGRGSDKESARSVSGEKRALPFVSQRSSLSSPLTRRGGEW